MKLSEKTNQVTTLFSSSDSNYISEFDQLISLMTEGFKDSLGELRDYEDKFFDVVSGNLNLVNTYYVLDKSVSKHIMSETSFKKVNQVIYVFSYHIWNEVVFHLVVNTDKRKIIDVSLVEGDGDFCLKFEEKFNNTNRYYNILDESPNRFTGLINLDRKVQSVAIYTVLSKLNAWKCLDKEQTNKLLSSIPKSFLETFVILYENLMKESN